MVKILFPVCPIAWKTLLPFKRDGMTPERDDLAVLSYSAQDIMYNTGISEAYLSERSA